MEIYLQGEQILTEKDFHQQFAKALKIEGIYSNTLEEFWDVLYIHLDQPLKIIWLNSEITKQNLGLLLIKLLTF